jgi:hypothetical protein
MKLPAIVFEDEVFRVILDENDEKRFADYEVYKCRVIYNSPKGKYWLDMLISKESTEEPEWYKHVCDQAIERYNREQQ